MRVAVVKAAHDDDASVWYVEHSDVEGLRVEGETFEAFCINIAAVAADLIAENGDGDGEIQIEIIPPFEIVRVNEADLSSSGPVLHSALALDCGSDILVEFHPHELFQAVALGEAFEDALAMLVGAAPDVVRHARVERSVVAIRHDVYPAASHASENKRSARCGKVVDGRDKRGHDGYNSPPA